MSAMNNSPSTSGDPASLPAMNQYGEMAMTHWKAWLPNRFQALENPHEFFRNLGQEVADQIFEVQRAMESQDRDPGSPPEDYLTRLATLKSIRVRAEQMVLTEMVWLDPEPQTVEEAPAVRDPQDPDLSPWMTWDGMPLDRDHRLWEMEADDDVSVADFLTARNAWEASLRIQVSRGEIPTDV